MLDTAPAPAGECERGGGYQEAAVGGRRVSMMSSAIRERILNVVLCLVLAPAAAFAQGGGVGDADPLSEALVPAPALSPVAVVRIQLEALRHNDEHDRGIEVAFRFASPANRANTGPLARFAGMIRNGPYALMLSFREADYGPVESRGVRARQRVTLADLGSSVTYWFYLSRQSEAPYADCWMTDAVYVEPFAGQSA